MGSGILVFVEHDHGVVRKSAFELLGKARQLAAAIGGGVSAALIGDANAASAAGFDTVYHVSGPAFHHYSTDGHAKALAAIVAKANPAVVLGISSPVGKDLFPRVGARLGAGVVTEVTELSVEAGKVVGRRPVYAGKAFVTARVNAAVGFFTVRPNSFPHVKGEGNPSVVAVDAGVDAASLRTKVIEVRQSESKVVDLTEAERIVSGGRSLKSAESFDAVIRPLAASIGATPGASRAAVDAGYAPHSAQVGQTGKVVNPTLYVACGISGAIQHLAGMRTSKVIVAINKDKDAPIFQHSSYGIVDDLFVICPLLQKEFERVVGG